MGWAGWTNSDASALVKKHLEKKAKITASVSVGDKPTMTPGSLER